MNAAKRDKLVYAIRVAGIHGEDREIVGYLLGRVYRVQVKKLRLAELNDLLYAPAATS